MTIKTILACAMLGALGSTEIISKDKKTSTKAAKVPKAAKPSFPHPGILLKNMNEEQLENTLVYAKAVNDIELATKTFFYLISQCKVQDKLKQFKLDFGDYFFNLEDYEKAAMAYEEFVVLWPGSAESEYSQYKATLCSFFMSLGFDHDQTTTQRTITLCAFFLQKAKNEKFITEIQNIYTTCRQRLFDHDVYVFETYLKMHKFKSAKRRLEYIEKEFQDIKHHTEYIAYCKEMLPYFENPKTRPFYIQLKLENALKKTEELPKGREKKLARFFLG